MSLAKILCSFAASWKSEDNKIKIQSALLTIVLHFTHF